MQVQPLRALCAVSEGNGLKTVPFPLPHLLCSVGTQDYHTGSCWLSWGTDSGQPGRDALGGCSLSQAFCLPHVQGMTGPFLFVVWAVCHWGLCQAAYGLSTVLTLGDFRVPPFVHPGKELTVSQLPVPLGSLSRFTCCPGTRATTSEVFQRSPMTQLL